MLLSFSLLFAKDIAVKYLNSPVNIDSFKEYNLRPSSLVKKLYYDDDRKYLIAKINRNFYQYCHINKAIVDKWVKSISLGTFYINNIKGNFPCKYNKNIRFSNKEQLKYALRDWLSKNLLIIDKKKSLVSFKKFLIKRKVNLKLVSSLNLNNYSSIENFISKNRPKSFSEEVIRKFLELNRNISIGDKTDPVYMSMLVDKLNIKDQRIICGALASERINSFYEMEQVLEINNFRFIKENFKLSTDEKEKIRAINEEATSLFRKLFKEDGYLIGKKFAKKNKVSSYAICVLLLSTEKEISGCKSVVSDQKFPSSSLPPMGYQFSKDCTNYDTGYDWAEENDINEYDDCIGLESSYFYEGCSDFVREYKSGY